MANELLIAGLTLGTCSLQHCIQWYPYKIPVTFGDSAVYLSPCSAVTTVASLYKTLMMSLDTSYLLFKCFCLLCFVSS